MALQQHRIVRFLIILAAVLLTIFIYASYYSNLTMTIPTTRIHQQQQSASLISTVNNNINSANKNIDESSGLIKNSNSIFVVTDKQNINKIQFNSGREKNNETRARQVIGDSNSSNSNSITVTNSSSSSSSSATISSNVGRNSSTIDFMKKSKISTTATRNSSVFANTLQKQTVTNATSASASATGTSLSSTLSSSLPLSSLQSSQSALPATRTVHASGQAAHQPPFSFSSSSSASSASSIKPPVSLVQAVPVDTSKGIPTVSIYESGHLDMNPLLCCGEDESLRLFIAITSAPTHREARLAIRQTWGHYGVRRDVSIAFILGRTTNQAIEDALSAENYMYGDLIRGRFIDSYNNLTLKTISALEWVDKNCPQATYVLKTDDDMFINVPKLLSFIDKHHNDKRTIFGRLAKKWKPIRNKKSKYYVSPGQFALTVFPQFTTGPAYLISSDIIHDLYIKSLEQTYLKLEDVYTTGIVAQLLNIKRIHVNEFLNRRIAFNPCNIRKAISVHMIKSNEQFDLWKKLLDTTTKCK